MKPNGRAGNMTPSTPTIDWSRDRWNDNGRKSCGNVEATEQAFQRWRSQQSLDLSEADREALLAMGEDMPKIWHAATTTATDRKQILRFLICDVMLDQKREQGQVLIKIAWATGASSEHRLRRKVQAYDQYAGLADLERRVRELNIEHKTDAEIAEVLNREGYMSARGTPFRGDLIHLLRQRWAIPTVKINGTQPNPTRWSDGSYSVQGMAVALGVTGQTVFKLLRRGRLKGRQLKKGMPWQIDVAENHIADLAGQIRPKSRSKMRAS